MSYFGGELSAVEHVRQFLGGLIFTSTLADGIFISVFRQLLLHLLMIYGISKDWKHLEILFSSLLFPSSCINVSLYQKES